jgi:hypothetical protein
MVIIGALSVTVLFNANSLVVKGESIYTIEEILQAGNIEQGVNLLRFDAAQAQQDIKDSLIELDRVIVRKVFPSSISIEIEGAQRVMSVESDGEYFDISRNGRIINSSANRPKDLVITGFTVIEPQVGGYIDCGEAGHTELVFKVIELIEKHDFPDLNRIDLSDRFDVRLFNGINEERIEVKLGAPIQLDEKIAMASNIISENIASNERGVLRIHNSGKGTFKPDLSG